MDRPTSLAPKNSTHRPAVTGAGINFKKTSKTSGWFATGSTYNREMALRVSALILMVFIVSAVTADDPKCNIPAGHRDGETVGFYDPEPRYG